MIKLTDFIRTAGGLAAILVSFSFSTVRAATTNDLVFEAEKAVLNGAETATNRKGFSGKGYVTGFDQDTDSVTFRVKVPADGHYLLTIRSAVETGWGSKVNDLLVNGQTA